MRTDRFRESRIPICNQSQLVVVPSLRKGLHHYKGIDSTETTLITPWESVCGRYWGSNQNIYIFFCRFSVCFCQLPVVSGKNASPLRNNASPLLTTTIEFLLSIQDPNMKMRFSRFWRTSHCRQERHALNHTVVPFFRNDISSNCQLETKLNDASRFHRGNLRTTIVFLVALCSPAKLLFFDVASI